MQRKRFKVWPGKKYRIRIPYPLKQGGSWCIQNKKVPGLTQGLSCNLPAAETIILAIDQRIKSIGHDYGAQSIHNRVLF
jgi:hypothetical protein